MLDVHYNSVGEWLRKYEAGGIDELFDKPKSGRPPILTTAEIKKVEKFIKAEPRQLKSVLAKIEEKLGKIISLDTLKRVIKSRDYTYRRVRKSLKSKRDEADFESKKKAENIEKKRGSGRNRIILFR